MSVKSTVFVLGAGFTKTFLPEAPLLVDYYDVDSIAKKFKGFPEIVNIIDSEKVRHTDGKINIESLMTRLHVGMPHDIEHQTSHLYSLLLAEVKKCFTNRIEEAKRGVFHSTDLANFASYCIENGITCITFNYDDVFDRSLWEVEKITLTQTHKTYWHPDGGYGFFCRPSICCVCDTTVGMDDTSMHLLKLHGSTNWYPRLGHSQPYAVEAFVHYEGWLPLIEPYTPGKIFSREEDIRVHLENEPFIVPPVLIKSAIMEQPILRLTWCLAHDALISAQRVVFIGYSMPITDITAGYLFGDSLKHLKGKQITIVNLAENDKAKKLLRDTYRRVFPWIKDSQFIFEGALDWSRKLLHTSQNMEG